MKTRRIKRMIVVAYDIACDRRRSKVVKILEQIGVRINYSVFECMITDSQYEKLLNDIGMIILPREDSVVYYPICLDCYSRIVYNPDRRDAVSVINIV